jgi:hypothetical protein
MCLGVRNGLNLAPRLSRVQKVRIAQLTLRKAACRGITTGCMTIAATKAMGSHSGQGSQHNQLLA